jgi:secreted protein with Ig-like and vWFA domain
MERASQQQLQQQLGILIVWAATDMQHQSCWRVRLLAATSTAVSGDTVATWLSMSQQLPCAASYASYPW